MSYSSYFFGFRSFLVLQILEIVMFAFLVQVSTALLALQALGASAHYLPPHIKPRDVNPYLMKAHGTGYKFLASSSGMSSLTIEGDDVVYTVDIVLGGHRTYRFPMCHKQ